MGYVFEQNAWFAYLACQKLGPQEFNPIFLWDISKKIILFWKQIIL